MEKRIIAFLTAGQIIRNERKDLSSADIARNISRRVSSKNDVQNWGRKKDEKYIDPQKSRITISQSSLFHLILCVERW